MYSVSSEKLLNCAHIYLQGVYLAENGTFDGGAFSAFPVSGWYWKVTAKTIDEFTNSVVMCVYVEGQIIPA